LVASLESRNLLSTIPTPGAGGAAGSSVVVSGTFHGIPGGKPLDGGALVYQLTDRTGKSVLPSTLPIPIFTIPGSQLIQSVDGLTVTYKFTVTPSGGAGGPYQIAVRAADNTGNAIVQTMTVDVTASGPVISPQAQFIIPAGSFPGVGKATTTTTTTTTPKTTKSSTVPKPQTPVVVTPPHNGYVFRVSNDLRTGASFIHHG